MKGNLNCLHLFFKIVFKTFFVLSYTMMIDNDLAKLPIDELLNVNGLVCVWCTNSQNHIDSLKSDFFPAWNVKYVACWYWIKV